MDNKVKYVLISGASSGIGRQIAIGLSASYNLVLNGRDIERLNGTKEECSKSFRQLIFECDLVNIDKLEEAISDFIKGNNIEISFFIHCAGFMKMIPLKMLTLDKILQTYFINTISATLIMKILVNRQINKAALESVVFLSSNISNFGAKAFSVYASSKAGLDSIMRCLAVELAPKVRINSVLPGAIPTQMSKEIFEDQEIMDRMSKTYPLGMGMPNDIFSIVEFLISEKSRWITGQQITVDGGRTINISG